MLQTESPVRTLQLSPPQNNPHHLTHQIQRTNASDIKSVAQLWQKADQRDKEHHLGRRAHSATTNCLVITMINCSCFCVSEPCSMKIMISFSPKKNISVRQCPYSHVDDELFELKKKVI